MGRRRTASRSTYSSPRDYRGWFTCEIALWLVLAASERAQSWPVRSAMPRRAYSSTEDTIMRPSSRLRSHPRAMPLVFFVPLQDPGCLVVDEGKATRQNEGGQKEGEQPNGRQISGSAHGIFPCGKKVGGFVERCRPWFDTAVASTAGRFPLQGNS